MFDSSNSEVFTGMLPVAIEGRVVEAGAEEDKPEGAEAIEVDQGSDTMKNSSQIWDFYHGILEKMKQRNEKKTESIKVWKILCENYLIEYNS